VRGFVRIGVHAVNHNPLLVDVHDLLR
jgi:hypothetical protein